MKRLVLLLLISLTFAGCTREKKEVASLPAVVGNAASDFSLSGPGGETTLSSPQGEPGSGPLLGDLVPPLS